MAFTNLFKTTQSSEDYQFQPTIQSSAPIYSLGRDSINSRANSYRNFWQSYPYQTTYPNQAVGTSSVYQAYSWPRTYPYGTDNTGYNQHQTIGYNYQHFGYNPQPQLYPHQQSSVPRRSQADYHSGGKILPRLVPISKSKGGKRRKLLHDQSQQLSTASQTVPVQSAPETASTLPIIKPFSVQSLATTAAATVPDTTLLTPDFVGYRSYCLENSSEKVTTNRSIYDLLNPENKKRSGSFTSIDSLLKTSPDSRNQSSSESSVDLSNPLPSGNLVVTSEDNLQNSISEDISQDKAQKVPCIRIPDFDSLPILVPSLTTSPSSDIAGDTSDPASPGNSYIDVVNNSPVNITEASGIQTSNSSNNQIPDSTLPPAGPPKVCLHKDLMHISSTSV